MLLYACFSKLPNVIDLLSFKIKKAILNLEVSSKPFRLMNFKAYIIIVIETSQKSLGLRAKQLKK